MMGPQLSTSVETAINDQNVMTAVVKWRAAFREIYGRTPTKNDYIMAPSHVKEEYFGGSVSNASLAVNNTKRKATVCLKRPHLEEEKSPVKRSSKVRRLCENSEIIETRTNFGNGSFTSPMPFAVSPVKFDKTSNLTTSSNDCAPEKMQSISSPRKSPKPTELPVFASLFDTPEKGQPAVWGEISPQKAIASIPTSAGSPLRSPRKPLLHREILVKNAECLLLPTPKNYRTSRKDTAAAFYTEKVRIVKRALKKCTPRSGVYSKKLEGNFVKINLKKKKFSRGKVSAEQKRKVRRRQKWKRTESKGG
ncbi:hypothetical protein KIN20_022411 [Parelaphostrongylus tenuis]|uniref:Uncharacterized protein n=1 Tax=Parelaphostrongylus tenuis TaxID=148309 RepID=A0AAD5N7Z1_PARTN|nr:hypothetical protein KIN20_022411 [Parelaphostrongylus tenuis]